MKLSIRWSLLLLLFAAVPAWADDAQQAKETNFNEMVVTATRTEKSIADAPGSVSIVTAKEMDERNIQSVDQALTLLPGVFDTRSKGLMATTTAVTLRGIPSQGRTLIMMDGLPINDAYSAGVQWGGLYAKDLQKIEVVEGPSSSLYGTNAMGGVVNLMTAMPHKREFTLSSGYGDEWYNGEGMANLWTAHASYGDKIGKWSYYASLGYRATDGYPTNLVVVTSAPTAASGITGATPTTNTAGAKRYLIGDTGDNGWWDYTANFRIQYDFSDTTNLRFSYIRAASKYYYGSPDTFLRNAAGAPVYSYGTTVTQSSFLSGSGSTTQDAYTISGETMFGNTKGKLTFGILNQGDNWYITPTSGSKGANLAGGPGTISETPNIRYYTDIQLSRPIMEKHILTGGFTFRYDVADESDTNLSNWRDPDSKSGAPVYKAGGVSMTFAAYLQAEIALLDSLTLYAGVRDDYWVSTDGYASQTTAPSFSSSYSGNSKNAVSPKGAVVWKPIDGTTLRISGGKAFNSPTIFQLFRSWTAQTASTVTNYGGNPYLNPETVLSWDASVDQSLWKGAKFKATYFENYMDNLIASVVTSVSPVINGITTTNNKYANVAGAESKGVELEAEQSFGKFLRLFTGYTYTDAHITQFTVFVPGQPNQTGKTLTQVPRHMLNAGIDASYGPASLLLTGRYVAKRYGTSDNSDVVNNVYTSYDPYFLMDLKAAYKVTNWATVSLAVDNLLNRRYFNYYRAPGQSWFASADFKF